MQKEKRSFLYTIAFAAAAYLVLMVIILTAVWGNTATTLEESADASLRQMANINNYEIDELLIANEQALAVVLQNNENIRVFEFGTENQRAVASQNMLQILKNTALSSSSVKTLFFFDLINDTYIMRPAENLNLQQITGIEDAIRELNEEYPDNMPAEWFFRNIGGKNYLLRLYKNKKRMLGAIVDIASIYDEVMTSKTATYILTDENCKILEQYGDGLSPEITELSEAYIDNAGWLQDKSHFIYGEKAARGNFSIFVAMKRNAVYGGFQVMQITILILIALAILLLLTIAVYARKAVYMPISDLLKAMKEIQQGDQSLRLSEDADSDEFMRINTSFNKMMDTIVNLRMKSYEERIQFDEATLKYVQLQIKPHFFLNALTTIHSMSYQGRNEDIREYIERLSRNVRYLFKSGLHTVPLSEEIEHAKDYIAMQDILYPNCVFDFFDIDEELNDYPIPQLVVHTILENIYKHAVAVDRLTSILVCAKPEEKDGEIMCHLSIEDDGVGFPEEFLEEVRGGDMKVKENGHGVGLWNLKKTLSLMYRRDDLIEFSNKDTGGSRVDILIPRRVKRQSTVWKL